MQEKRKPTRAASKGAEFWRDHLDRWRTSGMTQAEYCRRNELRANQFTSWKSRIEKPARQERHTRSRDSRNRLIELPSLFATAESGTLFELRLDDRLRLHVKIGANLTPAGDLR